jgi:hypothetical protein
LREFGIALLANAIESGELAEARERLQDQAEAERRAGIAVLEGLGPQSAENYGKAGPNQRVWGLVNKGEIFRRLVMNPRVLSLIGAEFSADYEGPDVPVETEDVLLSSSTGRKHLDQRNAPFKTPYPLTFNAICMLTDFTADNGATLVAPGSHLGTDPAKVYSSKLIPAVAPAGTIMLFDGRLVHTTGANITSEPRVGILNYYCRPFLRPQENYCLTLLPEVYENCGPALRALLGFKAWNTFGGVDGHHHGLMRDMRPRATGMMSVRHPG